MPDKCLDCPAPSADMDGFIVSGPGGAPRSEGFGVSSPEGPFVREAPQTGHVVIMGTLGADGNPGSLPDAPQVGWAYVAEDAGTYGGVQATEGDMVYCMSLNPVRWGVLQADSDDVGQDLASVSASFGCDPSPVLSLTSTKASGSSSVQTVDMSCLNGRYGALDSVSASMNCEAPSGQFSPYSPQSCRFYGYDYAGETPVEHVGMDYSLSGSTLSFRWLDDDARHVIVEPDGVPVDVDTIATIDAPAGSVYEGSSAGSIMRLELVSRTHDIASAVYVFSLSSALAGPVLSLTSTDASGAESIQTIDMSCLVPPVFDGTENGLVPASGAVQNYLLAGDGTWMRPVSNDEIDALFAAIID